MILRLIGWLVGTISYLGDSSEADRKRDCPFCILEKRIVRSLSVDLTLDAPMKILNCLRIFSEQFRGGHQEDAHEFLRYVIDACHNTCLRLKKLRRNGGGSGGTSVVKEIFGGALQSQVKCLSCGNESNKVDEIMDISLDVLHSNSLKDALQRFFQPEVLDGNNKYRCERYCQSVYVCVYTYIYIYMYVKFFQLYYFLQSLISDRGSYACVVARNWYQQGSKCLFFKHQMSL